MASMTEEQQIEIWRKEFEVWAEVKCYYLDLDKDGGLLQDIH